MTDKPYVPMPRPPYSETPNCVPVRAWACAFKCGSAVKTKHSTMWAHQQRCCRNPARRACQTCVHKKRDENGGYCEKLNIGLSESLRYDCPAWELLKPKEAA